MRNHPFPAARIAPQFGAGHEKHAPVDPPAQHLIIAVGCTNGTLSVSQTAAFQAANSGSKWGLVGYVTNNPGTLHPAIEFTYVSGTSLRSYADCMLTEEFHQAAGKLLEIGAHKRAAMMCAEAVYWRCHRRLVSDFLMAKRITVQHIMPTGELRPHKLTKGAMIESGQVVYPGEKSLFT